METVAVLELSHLSHNHDWQVFAEMRCSNFHFLSFLRRLVLKEDCVMQSKAPEQLLTGPCGEIVLSKLLFLNNKFHHKFEQHAPIQVNLSFRMKKKHFGDR